jgi:hypothetical protein
MNNKNRLGAAVTELAVSLPVLVTCVFGTLEICSGIYLRQTLTICAYEGLRAGTFHGSAPGEATSAAEKILNDRHITGASITFSPSTPEDAAAGTLVTVQVCAPIGPNCYRFAFLPTSDIVVTSTMVKE